MLDFKYKGVGAGSRWRMGFNLVFTIFTFTYIHPLVQSCALQKYTIKKTKMTGDALNKRYYEAQDSILHMELTYLVSRLYSLCLSGSSYALITVTYS